MAKPKITGAALVRAIHEESQQTRRGVTADMAATLVNAGHKNDRDRVIKMLATLREEGELRYANGRFWATEQGLGGTGQQSEPEKASTAPGQALDVETPACTGCDSQPGEYHNPECPAVNAFQAGRIPGEVGEHPVCTMLDALVTADDPARHHDHELQTDLLELLDGLITRTGERVKLASSDAAALHDLLAHCESLRDRVGRRFLVPTVMPQRQEVAQ